MLYCFIIVPGILTLLFYYSNFKKSNFLTAINDFLLFKKYLFNKKMSVAVNKVIVLTYFFIFAAVFISFSDCTMYSMFFDKYGIGITEIFVFLFLMLIYLLVVLVIRLIYEFLVIPMWYQHKMQNVNMPYVQQPINNAPMNNVVVQNQMPVSGNMNAEYKFCSQCGTRYSITESNCPNCGKN